MRVSYVFIVSLLWTAAVICEDEDEFEGVNVESETEVLGGGTYASPEPADAKSVYLWETFDDLEGYERRWVRSSASKDNGGAYDGEWSVEPAVRDAEPGDTALVLKSKAKHAAIATILTRPFKFDSATRPLIVQYEVTFQEGQECGGAYIKLISEGENGDLRQFRDTTPYTVMFGPDKCGNDHKLHFIFRHVNPLNGTAGERQLVRPLDERIDECFRDKRPHLYTLIVRPDSRYEVKVDEARVIAGSLLEDFEPPVNPPEEVDDPTDVRPPEWDDREKIPDPEAVKPEDWDDDAPPQLPDTLAEKPAGWLEDEPATIPDPEARRPDDWDDEMDGEWEAPHVDNPKCVSAAGCGPWSAPLIPNPAYRGKWRAPLVANPGYRGAWRPRRVPNPHHYRDETPFRSLRSVLAVGFELWSMSRDVLFDNVLVCDSERTADELAQAWRDKRDRAARDAESWWGRAMKATNHRPGWWLVYAVWCVAPLALYWRHVRARSQCQESFITRLLSHADERPWLWAVYLLAVGLPVALVIYCCCCGGPNEQAPTLRDVTQEPELDRKKTDEPAEDDEGNVEPDAELLPEVEPEPEEMEEGDELPAAGDAPVRRRPVRKE